MNKKITDKLSAFYLKNLRPLRRGATFCSVLFLVLLRFGFAPDGVVMAASSDTIQLHVTPVVTYGVSISSVNQNGYSFGTVSLNSVTHSTAAIVIENTGDVASQWQLKVTNSENWQPGTSIGNDQFVVLGVFTATETISQIDTGEFTDQKDEILSYYQTSTGTNNSSRYNGGVNMDLIPPSGQTNSKKSLWLKLKMPSSSSVATQQEFRLYITAVQIGQE